MPVKPTLKGIGAAFAKANGWKGVGAGLVMVVCGAAILLRGGPLGEAEIAAAASLITTGAVLANNAWETIKKAREQAAENEKTRREAEEAKRDAAEAKSAAETSTLHAERLHQRTRETLDEQRRRIAAGRRKAMEDFRRVEGMIARFRPSDCQYPECPPECEGEGGPKCLRERGGEP